MKHTSTLALLLLAASFTQAQPVLTFADNAPVAGSSFILHYGPYLTPGNAGAGQTWDLSALATDSVVFIQRVAPGTTPNGASFPGTTVAETGDVAAMYFRSANDGMYLVGSDADLVIFYSDQAKYLPFPCTYQTNWTDDFASVFEVDDTEIFRSGTVNGTADGYGTLHLPSGTENDVLRIHWHEETIDSTQLFSFLSVYDSYLYYAVGRSYPLVQLVTTSVTFMGQTTTTSYAQWVDALSTGTEERTDASDLPMYPVPAQGVLHFSLPLTFSGTPVINLTDAAGRSVRNLAPPTMDGRSGQLDVSGLAPGVYLFTAIDAFGQRAARTMVIE